MKKLALLIGLLVWIGAFAQIEKAIPPRPNPPKLVNDFAGMLTPDQQTALERKLVTYNDSTSSQIAIVIVDDLKGYEAA
ncbi:MAG TPA: TPM domain-containing protein, partial [Flavisolibacter sp.]